nr:hypothetical protein [Streptomyces sp. DHE17-7]
MDPDVARREPSWTAESLEMIASRNLAPSRHGGQGSSSHQYAEDYADTHYDAAASSRRVQCQSTVKDFGESTATCAHSGAQANAAAMFALLKPGDTIMGLNLAHGGHLTHGMKITSSQPTTCRLQSATKQVDCGWRLQGEQAEADRGRLVGLPAAAGLRRVPQGRRRGRRVPHGDNGTRV